MDFNNIEQLVGGMTDFLATHDIKNADLISCDAYIMGKDKNERLEHLMEIDKYGEYLGRYWNSMSNTSNFKDDSDVTIYTRSDGHLAAIWCRIHGMIDLYELFDYYDGYYVGARYMAMGRNVSNMMFAYYVTSGHKVTDIIELIGNNPGESVLVNRYSFGYDGDIAVLKSETRQGYEYSGGAYKLKSETDLLEKADSADDAGSRGDRVIDDQKELCKQLKEKAKSCKTLEDYVNAFFDVISVASDNPEEDISYTAGTNPFALPGMTPECVFNLMRWTPQEDDEYYQFQIEIRFDVGEEKIPFDNLYRDYDKDFRTQVLESESFKALKDKKITNVSIEVIET